MLARTLKFSPLRRRRSGSVLILVIALLVLLALMGTAFISTSRNERGTAVQNNANTQADLLLQGLVQATQAATTGELYGPSAGASGSMYRPPLIDVGSGTYNTVFKPYTSSSSTLFLSDRTPYLSAGLYKWAEVSWPLFEQGLNSSSQESYQFDSPVVGPGTTTLMGLTVSTTIGSTALLGPTALNQSTSDAKQALAASGAIIGFVTINGQTFPTLTVGSPAATVVAADADGDGVADAGLFKLPVAPIDGITYYGAVRVVDGNSAVNVNTAAGNVDPGTGNDNDYATTGAPANTGAFGTDASGATPVGFFPASVGLQSLLYDNTLTASSDFPRAEYFIFDQQICPVPCTSNPTSSITLNTPITDAKIARPDFTFTTLGDFTNAQLARRLNNPGYFQNGAAGNYFALTPFSLNDAAALASGFCIKSGNSTSDIETWLRYSLTNASGSATPLVATAPYSLSANSIANWYTSNFSFDAELGGGVPRMPSRSVLTTWNPVSEYAPQHYVSRSVFPTGLAAGPMETKLQPINAQMLAYDPDVYVGGSPATHTYVAGDFVKFKDPSVADAPYRCYQCLTSPTTTAPIITSGSSPGPYTYTRDFTNWREEPWTETPTKANVNTADFPTLWRAFYNTMADSSTQTPNSNGDSIPPLPGTTDYVTYADTTPSPVLTTAPAAGTRSWGPFRDPSRNTAANSAGHLITAGEMLQVRAGLAAVNTIDARDSDDDVTSRTFTVYSDVAQTTPAYKVTVFGHEKQLYISAVVVDYTPAGAGPGTANVTIEMYNPDSAPITINNWQIASVTRSATGIKLAQVAPGTVAIPTATIPAKGYMAITNAASLPNTNYTPAAGTIAVTGIVGLDTIAANAGSTPATGPTEVAILKPRLASGAYSSSVVFDNVYDETPMAAATAVSLANLVPVDMIDFAGAFTKDPNATKHVVYERPHGTSAGGTDDFNWQFVFPGFYDPTATVPQAGWQQLTAAMFNGGQPTNTAASGNPTVSVRSSGVGSTFPYKAIQLACTGWIGPNPTSGAAPYLFPFAAFARNGDILKVPFIGAYVIQDTSGTGNIVAINSITMDASEADVYTSLHAQSSTGSNVAQCQVDEAVGRFVPLAAIDPALAKSQPTGGATPAAGYQSTTNPGGVVVDNDPYGWAAKIFDYLDVQVANDDYLPNVDPRFADGSNINNTQNPYSTVAPGNPGKYPAAGVTVAAYNSALNTSAITVANQTATPGFANGTFEESVGKQGLININTAPAVVLAQLPGVDQAMATAIVTDRTANGPFKTIFDLNRVAASPPNTSGCFQTEDGKLKLVTSTTTGSPPTTTYSEDDQLADDPGAAQGDFSPGGSTFDGVRNDFEEKTLMLTRISNLITTRSDTFTCYVLLQGWRNAGTANATLAVQRRAAFILDRTNVTASNSRPQTFTVPTP